MPGPQFDLIGVAEAAELLGVERRTVLRWADAGRITVAHRMTGTTGALLFERAEVERVRAATSGERSA